MGIIASNMLWHPKPSDLNDLFEFRPAIDLNYTKSEYHEIIDDLLLSRKITDAKAAIAKKNAEKFIEKLKCPDRWNGFEKLIENHLNNMGVCSFSLSSSSPMLWGQYANSGRGIALEFEIPDDEINHTFFKVRYSYERALFRPIELYRMNDSTIRDITHKLLCTKSIEWFPEFEIRSFSGQANLALPCAGEIKRIILGPKISSDDIAYLQNKFNSSIFATSKLSQANYDVIIDD